MRNGNITRIDLTDGDGSYKMELSNLTENNIKEIEMLAEKWKQIDDDNISTCILLILTDAAEGRFKDYGVSLKDCIEWFKEKVKAYPGNVQKVKEDPVDEPIDKTNDPTEYGKYVDECLNNAAQHYFSKGEDSYTLADMFYAGIRCERNYKEKSEK